MHGVCLLAPLSLRFSLYFQQVYSGYTLGFIYFIPNFDYDFLVRDLRFPNSEGTYVAKFQLPFQCCIWTVDLHKWEVRDGGGRLVEVSGAKKALPLCFYHVYQEFEQRKEGVRKRHIIATLLLAFSYPQCVKLLVHLFAYTHGKSKEKKGPKVSL